MRAHVVTVSSREPEEAYYRPWAFRASLEKLGAEYTVLGHGERWGGLMTKARHYRDWLRAGGAAGGTVIVCDCWDLVFQRHPDEIAREHRGFYGDAVVFNGEKACWPRADLAEKFPPGDSAWRYLNSGFMCGPAGRVLELFEWLDLEAIGEDRDEGGTRVEPNDQGEIQRAYVDSDLDLVVDTACRLAQTFSGCRAEEFCMTPGGLQNMATGSFPGALHFNGASANELMPEILEWMDINEPR